MSGGAEQISLPQEDSSTEDSSGTMGETDSFIERFDDNLGVHYEESGKTIEKAWSDIERFSLVALTLKGHKKSLFKKHLSFNGAKDHFDAPIMSKSHPLGTLATLNVPKLKKRLSLVMTSLLESIFHLEFSDDVYDNESKMDKPYLRDMLSTLVKFPPRSYNEVRLEFGSKKKLVGGSIDVVIGSETNGDKKPCIDLKTSADSSSKVAIYLGSLLEAKASWKRLANEAAEEMFDEEFKDMKVIIQPMLETMAIAEVAKFPNKDVPILNILGNRYVYRPLLYFKEKDIILTTPGVVHLRRNATTVDTQGLLLLFTLFQLHETEMCVFDKLENAEFPKSGWQAAAQGRHVDNYQNSELTVVGAKNFPHAESKHLLHAAAHDDDQEHDDEDDDNNHDDDDHPTPTKRRKTCASHSTKK